MFLFSLEAHAENIGGLDSISSSPSNIQTLVNSVAVMINSHQLNTAGNRITPTGFNSLLCPGQTLSQEPQLGYCTGKLVSHNLILTAAHCFPNAKEISSGGNLCNSKKFLFGFDDRNFLSISSGGTWPVSSDSVYDCAKVEELNRTNDYAIVRLERSVSGIRPLGWRKVSTRPSPDDPLFLFGGSMGTRVRTLPATINFDALVETNEAQVQAKYRGSRGSSGGPIINTNNTIEGINVGGPKRLSLRLDEERGCNTWVDLDELGFANRVIPASVFTRDLQNTVLRLRGEEEGSLGTSTSQLYSIKLVSIILLNSFFYVFKTFWIEQCRCVSKL